MKRSKYLKQLKTAKEHETAQNPVRIYSGDVVRCMGQALLSFHIRYL